MSATKYHPPAPSAQRTIYVDDELIVVDKPAGLLSVPGRGPEKAVCAQTYAAAMFGTALVVHRLDMDT
ncbi:MAG: RNA pseudouridine synthase, partial [Pseudomonadota bacterium]